MENIKLAIIFYSATGANYQLAQWAEAAAKNAGADVRLRRIKETAPEDAIAQNPAWKKNIEAMKDVAEALPDDLDWADAYLFSSPTRYGMICGQLKTFIDTTGGLWMKGKLANKAVSGMSTASNPHGGQEATILSLYTQMMHWGCIIAAPGYKDPVTFKTGGNPYGVSATVDMEGNLKDDVEAGVQFQVKQLLEIAGWIAKGKGQ